jgi:lipid II:glycine glycyltransferase (peptidoglycan interpeptide bridge formation enzyme)
MSERIASQSLLMMGAVDDWLDTWGSNPSKFDPKSFRISKHLNDVKCTQAHARKIKEWYTDEIAEFTEVLQPPSKAQRDTMSERVASQSLLMMGAVDDWLDTWGSNPSKFDPKSFRISKHLNDVKCTQAHARKIKEWYTDEIAEFTEVLQPPSKAQRDTMSERDRDYAEQLIEAYADFEKKDVKKYLEALTLFMGACDIIIDTAKANRKPRKRIRSKEKMVSKLRFRVNDEKFQLASINPQEIIGAEELWVFNINTRQLGRYVASSKDPKLFCTNDLLWVDTC